ncbi:ANL family adenylate-forming protein [Sphingobacterium faecium]|uniref:ANL family adenylate-forming protein n=1 Tax=Sphingobacterium faecium TaxID=34087 RepID=UPI003208B958
MDSKILESFGFKRDNYNILSDLHLRITYSDALEILPTLHSVIYRNIEKSPDQCIIFFCKNQLLDLLILVVLIAENQNFVLLNGNNKNLEDFEIQQFEHCSRILYTDFFDKEMEFLNPHNIRLIENKYFRLTDNKWLGSGKIMFKSSGSTGDSKVVIHKISALIRHSLRCSEHLAIDFKDRVAIPVPINHMYGLGAGLLPSLMAGASLILVNNTNIPLFFEAERLLSPNIAFLTPGILKMYLNFKKNRYHYKSIISAGDELDRISALDIDSKFGKLINLYGSTELGVIATSKNMKSYKILCPLPDVKIYSAPFQGGFKELICEHPNPFIGYYNINKRTFESVTNNGNMFNTHDLIIETENIEFQLSGRSDFCVNRNGVLMSLIEVEAQIKLHLAEINEIVIIQTGEFDIYRGHKISAYFVLNCEKKLSEDELKSRCREFLESYKIPDTFVEIPEMPHLTSGKPDRQKIKSIYMSNAN